MKRALQKKLSVKQLAEAWGWSVDRVYRLVHHKDQSKRLPWTRIGGAIVFNVDELEAWLAARSQTPAAPPVSMTMAEYDAAFRRKHGLADERADVSA